MSVAVDRTADFMAAVSSVKAEGGVMSAQTSAAKPAPSDHTRFTEGVKSVGWQLHQTSLKLNEMTKLVKKRALFDDKSATINQLTRSIKEDITALNSDLGKLEQFLEARKVGGDRGRHAGSLMTGLKTQLMQTTSTFKHILEKRKDTVKDTSVRRSKLGGSNTLVAPPVPLFNPTAGVPAPGATRLGADRRAGAGTGGAAAGGRPRFGDSLSGGGAGAGAGADMFLDPAAAFQPVTQAQLMPETGYLEERANAVADVEQHIGDLGVIFNKLATMVAAQGAMFERIDDDVSTALVQMEAGEDQLRKRYESVSSWKGLALKVGGILFLFLVVFMLFFA